LSCFKTNNPIREKKNLKIAEAKRIEASQIRLKINVFGVSTLTVQTWDKSWQQFKTACKATFCRPAKYSGNDPGLRDHIAGINNG